VADSELEAVAEDHVEGARLLRVASVVQLEERSPENRLIGGIGGGEGGLEEPRLVLSRSLFFLIVDQEGRDDPVIACSSNLAAHENAFLGTVRH
jgi:hypothetical protein